MSKVIVDIGPKIKRKMKSLGLKPEVSPIEFLEQVGTKKHRYFSVCQTITGEKVVFYARLHDNPDAKYKFINEIKFLKKIKESDLPLKKVVPEIFASKIEKDYEWLVRAHIDVPPLGHSRDLKRKIPKKIISQITKNIYEISKLPHQKLGLELKRFNPKNYLVKDNCQDLINRKLISSTLAKQITKFAENNFNLLKKENHYPNHGDLNLGNILIQNSKFWLIDWELLGLNNFAYDISYLWAHLWQAPQNFRQELLNFYLKKLNLNQLQKFKKLLPVVTIYLSLGGITFRKTQKEKLKILKKRQKYYLKLLTNCVANFNKLIKT